MLAAQDQIDQEIAEEKKIADNREQADILWAHIAPRLHELPALYAYATEMAQVALKSAFSMVFRPGSVTERAWLVRAAQDRPDLVTPAQCLKDPVIRCPLAVFIPC